MSVCQRTRSLGRRLRPGRTTRSALVVAVSALAASPSWAQEAEIGPLFDWATPDRPGCVVAVSKDGTLLVNRAFGSADLERDVPLSPASVFDIGSVRKQFIAASVLLLVEDGRLSLDDDVREHIPELPDYGHTITLDHLLTHTSGIRDWTGILPLVGGDVDVLGLILRQQGLNFRPGDEWSYSNSGYVLLKEIVVRASGVSFPEFTRIRLFEPLGMTMTTYEDDLLDVIDNRALAYEKQGDGWRQDMLVGDQRGSGGALFSTALDLVLWNEALAEKRLGGYVTDKLHEPTRLNNGRLLRYARGVIVSSDDGLEAMVHTGGAGGYSTWLGRLPQHGLSIAILCNSDDIGASAIAGRLVDQLVPAEAQEAAADGAASDDAPAVEIPEAELASMGGMFFDETGEPLRLVAQGGTLRVAGGPALTAVAPDRFRNPRGNLFFMSQDEFELRFVSRDEIELTTMEGHTRRYLRAQPPSLSEADLGAFAGRYGTDEIGAVFEIVPAGDGLLMRFELSPDKAIPLRPAERDTFQVGRMTVRFVRDQPGEITGFDYSNPVVRNIRFRRLSDHD